MPDPVEDPVWTPILGGLHATALDCLQTSFALLADEAHGTGSHLALGAVWSFPQLGDQERGEQHREGGVAATAGERAEQAAALLGMRTDGRWMRLSGPQIRRLAEGWLYVTADAYALPWCPYAGHEHMRHSFLVNHRPGTVTVVDGYHNDTAWGPARPGVWRMDVAAFDAACSGGAHALAVEAGPLPALDPAAVLVGNAQRRRTLRPAVEAYLTRTRATLAQPDGLDRFVLDVWLLGRERQLHEDWLDAVLPGADVDRQGERWQQLASRSYLATRRAQAGRPAAPVMLDSLADDLAGLLLSPAAADPAPGRAADREGIAGIESVVRGALRDTLHVDDERMRSADTLRELPGFNSFLLVDVIERVEHDLGVHVPGEALTADNLRDVDSLCAMFATAGRNGR